MPIGTLIPHFIKAIIGIATSPSCLSSCHCPSSQYLILTLDGILYRALKLSKPSSKSTKWANLPISKRDLRVLRRLREVKGAKEKKTQRKEKKSIWKNKVKRFVKTYLKKRTDLLRLALVFCKGMSSLSKFAGSVYEC